MIDVAAAVGGQSDLLAPRGEPPEVPSRAGEGALRVLPVDADDRQAVGLQLEPAARPTSFDPEAGVDRWKGDRNLLLPIVGAQALERPAGDRNVGIGADPLGVDEAAQPVVAA